MTTAAQSEPDAGPNRARPSIDPEAIAKRFAAQLYQYARQLTWNVNDAHDLVQDTFERCLRKLPSGLPPVRVQHWLNVTLRHRYIDLCRSRERRAQVNLCIVATAMHSLEETEEEPEWSRVEPDELWHCVQRLKPNLREVFLLRNRDQRTHAQIATQLSIPVSTVGTRCFRAAKHLRKMLSVAHQSQDCGRVVESCLRIASSRHRSIA